MTSLFYSVRKIKQSEYEFALNPRPAPLGKFGNLQFAGADATGPRTQERRRSPPATDCRLAM